MSINSSVPGSALYLNTTRATDLDGDGEARFDEAGTGFREITKLYQGVTPPPARWLMAGIPPSIAVIPMASKLSSTSTRPGR